ncbi:MAG: isochorismatase family protein [Pseudomonadota bacterium]
MSLDILDYRKSALLVIDLQNAFLHEKGTLGISGVDTKRLSAIVPPLEKLIKRCQDAGIPVIWTMQEHFALDASRAKKKLLGHTARRKQVSALAGSWDEQIIDELKPLADFDPAFVIRKHRFGAFYETRLEMMLKMLGTQHLFITGATTNACVETSIREAYLRDLDVIAVDDCISGVNVDWETTAKAVWKQYFCEIAASSEIIEWIGDQLKPRVVDFGHQLILVSDLEKSVDYYVNLLGFKIRPAKPLADGRPFTAFHQGIALISGKAADHRQIDHIAFQVNDVRAMDAKLKKAGVQYYEGLHNGPYGLTIYVADPDGTKIELYQVGETV